MELHYKRGETLQALALMAETNAWTKEKTGEFLWNPLEITLPWIQEHFPSFDAQNIITAYEGEELAGMAFIVDYDPVFWPDEARGAAWYLHRLCVRRSYAGKGVSHAIVRHCAEIAQGYGASHFRLDTRADSPKLCQLYESMGFRRAGVTQADLGMRTLLVQLFEIVF